jgi:hypothetical protein
MYSISLSFSTSRILEEQSRHTDEPYIVGSMRTGDSFHIRGPTATEIRYEVCWIIFLSKLTLSEM